MKVDWDKIMHKTASELDECLWRAWMAEFERRQRMIDFWLSRQRQPDVIVSKPEVEE